MALIDFLRRSQDPVTATVEPATAASAGGQDMAQLFDEELLARLRRLALMSKRSIADGLAGEHRSRRRGSSPEFADFKSYTQGDDYRRIDWNIFSRLDEVFVRLSEVTTELSVHILLDASNSMDWRGSPTLPLKHDYARRIAGSLGYVALWHFDRVVITPFGRELGASFGPAQGRAQILPMLSFLAQQGTLGETDLPLAIERYARSRRRPGILVIVSDLLSGDPPDLQQSLRLLRTHGWQIIVAQVIDGAELDPALDQALDVTGQPTTFELRDVENDDRLRLTPTSEILDRYRDAVATWREQIEAACNDEACDYLALQTDWPLESIVLTLLHHRGLVA